MTINFLRSLICSMFFFSSLGVYAGDDSASVLGIDNSTKEKCIENNMVDCIESVCSYSMETDCTSQCKDLAKEKCKALSKQ